MSVPNVDDPVLAVVLERLDRMKEDFANLRQEVKEEISSVRKDVSAIKEDQASVKTVLTKASGGYLVILGLGGLVTYALGFWDKVAKLWAH